MQYHCVQCNEYFNVDAADDKPRCPKCLRQHGLRQVEAARAPAPKPKWVPLVLGLSVLAAAGGGYAAYAHLHKHVPGQVPLAPVDPDDLRADVKAITGADVKELANILEPDAHVRAFAEKATKGQSKPEDRAKAIVAALAERRQKQAFVEWTRVEPREGPPLTAAATLASLKDDGTRKQLYPLELACLGVSALRSLGVPALVAEVYKYPNERDALDPSGRFGYFAIALRTPEQTFDAYGARATAPAKGDYKLLTDAQVVGAALAIRALQRVDANGDTRGGLADSELAVKLDPSSASARSARASLLLATGGIEAGTHELDAAVQLRGDAARRNNLATLGLLSGNTDGAAKEVAAALTDAPDYALAHITLATVHLMRGERDLARTELEQAERLEPDLAQLPQIWAQFYASDNDMPRALQKAQEALRRRPKDTQAMLVLARIDRAAGRYDDMRAQAKAIMARTGPDEHDRMQTLLRSMLGPTVFEPSAGSDDEAPSHDSSDSLSLSGDTSGSAKGPHLLSDAPGGAATDGALQLQPGASKLHLGAGDSKLKLKLEP
jgi:Tfp pilus assembly protein PilF